MAWKGADARGPHTQINDVIEFLLTQPPQEFLPADLVASLKIKENPKFLKENLRKS